MKDVLCHTDSEPGGRAAHEDAIFTIPLGPYHENINTEAGKKSLERRRRLARIMRRQMPVPLPDDELGGRGEIDWNIGNIGEEDEIFEEET